MADLEVDGAQLHDVSPRAWHLFRSGMVEQGERWWTSSPSLGRHMIASGWALLGHDPVGRRWLLWRPVPAVPAIRADRESREFGCARCGAVLPDFLAFGVGGGGGPSERHYCLHHIPRRVRLSMWLRGLVRRG